MNLGRPKDPYIRGVLRMGMDNLGDSIRNIWHEPKFFGRWQQ